MAGASGNGHRYSSSPELSDPPSMLSAPTSPTGHGRSKTAGAELDEIIVDPTTIRYDAGGQPMLTKDGLPRRKPGPKPGSKIKRHSTNPDDGTEKPKRARKPKDPNAPPRRRKTPHSTSVNMDETPDIDADGAGNGPSGSIMFPSSRQPKITEMTTLGRLEPIHQAKRDSLPGSMSNILNADPEPQQAYHHHQQTQQQAPSRPSVPSRPSGTAYDPIRSSNYDPVRETMVTHNYANPLGSPRGPSATNVMNRASASPSIASLVDPPVQQNIISPVPSHTSFKHNAQPTHPSSQQRSRPETNSVPVSPNPFRKEFAPPPAPTPPVVAKKSQPPTGPSSSYAAARIEIRPQSITTIGAAGAKRTPPKNHSLASSSPRMGAAKDALVPLGGGSDRSILDFGKAEPGSELVVPSIVLNIPLNGETNKYVNFMRMAEDQYGWDALHPRQAEQKARKARIAAASAALAQNDSSREGDEMSVDESDNDDSNVEMGGVSGPDKPEGKPVKKKRHFKEDEYDKDDDFVDDSEMLWEEQAAASRDGFFVYSGPLVPEVEKPAPGHRDGLPKRGRGSRGGRGGSRGAGTGTGRGRGGGPGSRGGIVRKPRMTKADKAQMDREKAEREAAFLKSTNGGGQYNVLHPSSPKFAGL
ncbi:HPC2-domain-containing protein [Xylariaceae sp. FL0016]|nr:HPC2-domain-containing protein [Xylariaceae sp. FL0016]